MTDYILTAKTYFSMTNKYSFLILYLCLFFCHGICAQTNQINWTDQTSSIQNSTLDDGTDPEDNRSSAWRWGTPAVRGWKLTGLKGTTGAWIPEQNKFYHMVGVYDRNARTITLYRDGENTGSVSAKGKMVLAKSNDETDPYKYHKFTLVGDPAFSNHNKEDICAQTIPSEVVMARMYDGVLTEAQVKQLYEQVKPLAEYEGTTGSKDQASADLVTNVQYLSEVDALNTGSQFVIYADGLQSGDQIEFTDANSSSSATKATTFTSSLNIMTAKTGMQRVSGNATISGNSASCTLPTTAGTYKMTLTRNGQTQNLGYMRINSVVSSLNYSNTFGIVAHRGVHTSAPENSKEALRAALEANYYGSETDIRMSSDGTLFVIHDQYFDRANHKSSTISTNNLEIESTAARTIKSECTLTNGEVLPTLEELLDIMKESQYIGKSTKLVIEVKTNKKGGTNLSNTKAAAKAAMDLVNTKGLNDRVEYIAFSWETCKDLVIYAKTKNISNVSIQYLCNNATNSSGISNYGGQRSQTEMQTAGITGLDYDLTKVDNAYLFDNQTYNTFHTANMTVNVWTINTLAEARKALEYGCDYITTNIPAELVMLKEYIDLNNNITQ